MSAIVREFRINRFAYLNCDIVKYSRPGIRDTLQMHSNLKRNSIIMYELNVGDDQFEMF